MMRHMVLAAAMAVGLSAAVLAAERATFVLTDGSRQSGEIVFHGSGNRNIIDNFLNLGQSGSPDRTYPMDQVATIDFDSGQPSPAEFQQLPAGGGDHLLVLRGGGVQRGRLLNLINGDTVQWQNEGGQTQQYAIRDVSRIYLNPDAARRIYPQVASAAGAATPAQGTTGSVDTAVPSGGIRIPANQQWVQTGVMVRKGQRVAFAASGQVHFSAEAAHTSGPDGNPSVQTAGLPVSGMSVGGLIARVGNSQPFPIGSNRSAIVMPETGMLMLGVNDTNVSDNSGEFVVQLQNAGR